MLVAGSSGAGKSTLARSVARLWGLSYVEIDSLFHGPAWVKRPEFEADVEAFTALECWVTEWQYSAVRPLLAERADLVLWLDYPRPLVMWRVTRRTLSRRLQAVELWNGNREPPLATFLTDRDHVVRWAWRTHERTRRRVEELAATRPDLPIVRFTRPSSVAAWLASQSERRT